MRQVATTRTLEGTSSPGPARLKSRDSRNRNSARCSWAGTYCNSAKFRFRQLDLLLGIGVGLALAHRLLHRSRKILQVSELVARIVLGPGLLAARPRMTGNERLPIHRDDLFQSLLDVRDISVGHAAELHALDRDPVDREDDLL